MNRTRTFQKLTAWTAILLVSITISGTVVRASSTVTPDVLFNQANQAYDQGDYARALQQYEQMIQAGYTSVETWFNAANAAFRKGDPGQAVLYYRRAWYLNPRDADVTANLELAQERTGALKPAGTIIGAAASEFSHREWTIWFKAAYWTTLVAIVVAIFLPSARRFAKPVAITAGFLALVGMAGWLYWQNWRDQQEAVVIMTKQTAMYEPREKATPFFATPEGSIVYIEDAFHSWIKVRAGQKTGWLPKSAVALVYPWQLEVKD